MLALSVETVVSHLYKVRETGHGKKCTDALLSRWVDLLNEERDRGLTTSQEQQAYAALREFIRGLPCET